MFDLLITDCRVIDGSNTPWYRADVAVKDGKTAAVGKLAGRSDVSAAKVVDGHDKYLAPGFIDIHSHSDTTIMTYPRAESRVLQGVTTEIGGNCGMSSAPVSHDPQKKKELAAYIGDMPYTWNSTGEFLDRVAESSPSVNFGTAVGHGTLRIAAMGFSDRRPDEKEMNTMKSLLRQSLSEGAFAMTSGLISPRA